MMDRIFRDDGVAAVSTCNLNNALLLFFVDGGNEAARQIFTVLDSCLDTLEEHKFVILATPLHSDLHLQFEAIYGPTPVNTVTFIASGGAALVRWAGNGEFGDLIKNVLMMSTCPEAEMGEFGYPSEKYMSDQMLGNLREQKVLLANGSASSHESMETVVHHHGSTGKKIGPVQPRDQTVLQIRTADGSSMTNTFSTSSLLSEVREMIEAHFSLSDGFGLATSFPRYHYVSQDYDRSLEELNLWPNAVLLIVPADSREMNSSTSLWNYTATLSNWAYTAVIYVWNRISRFFSFNSSDASHPGAQDNMRQQSSQPGPSTSRRPGNIHTLRDTEKDDDKRRTTYNGNSTQQL